MPDKIQKDFYQKDALDIAPEILGHHLVRVTEKETFRHTITEVEIYRGEDDTGCHVSRGKTKRTEIMYREGGLVYVYLIYGMHWMFNIVTGKEEQPQALLVRGISGFGGPGKLTKHLQIDGSFYGEDLSVSDAVWIEKNSDKKGKIEKYPRIGIDYAQKEDRDRLWRLKWVGSG
jgi:DNA-3-methyladenine glycosylase